jgi:hypothetical protein
MARGADGSLLTKDELEKLNLERYNQAIANGNLYNTGPIVEGGTSFAPERWDEYFNKNESLKPKNYVPQKEMQAQLDAGEEIDTSSQEFVVDRDDVEIISEEDMKPSYPSRGNDNSFLTVEQAKAESGQSDLSKEVQADMAMEAEIEADSSASDEFDSPVSEWVKEFEELSDEEFKQAGLAIGQLPANAQEAYAKMAGVRDDIKFEDAIKKGAEANQAQFDELPDIDASDVKSSINQKASDAKDRIISNVDDELINLTEKADLKEIDDVYNVVRESKGMMFDKATELGEGSPEAMADMLARDQAGDMEISDMKGKDAEITTTIMKDTGLDMNQANALMGKLKGLCG